MRLLAVCSTFLLTGCYTDRINKLEEQNADVRARLRELEMQFKCTQAARSYFNERWARQQARNPSTELLEYAEHYSKVSGSCLVRVDYHWSVSPNLTEVTIEVADVYRGVIDASYEHDVFIGSSPSVGKCKVKDSSCKTLDEFSGLLKPLMWN